MHVHLPPGTRSKTAAMAARRGGCAPLAPDAGQNHGEVLNRLTRQSSTISTLLRWFSAVSGPHAEGAVNHRLSPALAAAEAPSVAGASPWMCVSRPGGCCRG